MLHPHVGTHRPDTDPETDAIVRVAALNTTNATPDRRSERWAWMLIVVTLAMLAWALAKG